MAHFDSNQIFNENILLNFFSIIVILNDFSFIYHNYLSLIRFIKIKHSYIFYSELKKLKFLSKYFYTYFYKYGE